MKTLEIKLNELSPVELRTLYSTLKNIDIELAIIVEDYLKSEYNKTI